MSHSTQSDSHFVLKKLLSTVLSEAATERVYCHLKQLKTEAFEPAEAFHCNSTITGTQLGLAAPEPWEACSLHCIPLSMVCWKPFGCLSLQALAPKWRVEYLMSIQLARKTSGIWWKAEMAVWELSSQPEPRKKEALRGNLFITNAWGRFCMCTSILSPWKESDMLFYNETYGNEPFSNRLQTISLQLTSCWQSFNALVKILQLLYTYWHPWDNSCHQFVKNMHTPKEE